MRDPRKQETQAGGPGLPKDEKLLLAGKSFLSVPRRFVNLPGLFFRVRPLPGLLASGVWCDRLALWIPMVDMTARLLRDVVGGQI